MVATLRLSKLRQQVINSRIHNPCATLQEIGEPLKISRERVRQILKAHKLPTRKFVPTHPCLNCGKSIKPKTKTFCTKECRTKYMHIQVECSECGKLFTIYQPALINRMKERKLSEIFCSKQCYGRYWGMHHGKPLHPNHEEICGLTQIGWRPKLISEILGVRLLTVYGIIMYNRKRMAKSY